MIKKCEQCGNDIAKKPSESAGYFATKKYCSNHCHDDFRRGKPTKPPRECIRCGAPIYGSGKHLSIKYCGQDCYWNDLRDGVGIKKPYKQYEKKCEECGIGFQTTPSQNGKYCSRECALKKTAIMFQDVDQSYKTNTRVERVKRKCVTCGKPFDVWPYEVKVRPCDYCSNICQIKATGALDETSIEKKVRHELERRGIPFVAQARVGNFFADFKIGNMIIECDGTYWHSLPENVERDGRKNNYYGKHGYAVYRFTDKEINADVRGCVDIVEKAYSEDMSVACR